VSLLEDRWLIPVAVVACASTTLAQGNADSREHIAVHVTAVNGPVVTVDRGASSGIRVGDEVVFKRIGRPRMTGVVLGASENEARVELDDLEGDGGIGVGFSGEVLVPRDRAVADGRAGGTPEHPPWEEPVGTWAPGQPLLAPARSPAPDERDSDLRGRVFTRFLYTDDAHGERTYGRMWTGTDLTWSNPFDGGGAVRFKGDVSYRDYMTGSRTEDETITRIQRFSYVLGGRQTDARRVEVGRFLSSMFPEFGLIDGVEYIQRFEGGDQLGGSVGFIPDYQDDLAATDDLSTALFYRWVEGPAEEVALAAGYQKTWHNGQADRDLLAGSAQWLIGPQTTFRSTVLVDYYDSTAQLESQGFELTELHASLNQRIGTGAGAGIYASYYDWPELLSDEFPDVLPITISDQKVARGGVNGWTRLREGVTLYGRLDAWSDDQNSGNFADLRVDLRDIVYTGSSSSIGAFQSQGSFTDGVGARLMHTHWFGASSLRIGYDAVRYTQSGFLGEQSNLLQHLLRLGLDSRLTTDLDLTVDAEQRFGDEQNSLTLGLRLNWRF